MKLAKHHEVLTRLSYLPRKIVAFHGDGAHYVTEFVLHELCDVRCFNVKKAAYFVDNPDFDCLHGIAGFHQDDHGLGNGWDTTAGIEKHLSSCKFHQEVRALRYGSYKRSSTNEDQLIRHLARELHIDQARSIVWDLKHDNHGVLIYQIDYDDAELQQYLHDGVHFLSLCPIN